MKKFRKAKWVVLIAALLAGASAVVVRAVRK